MLLQGQGEWKTPSRGGDKPCMQRDEKDISAHIPAKSKSLT